MSDSTTNGTPDPTRAEINRANSQHSTGPRTPAGKQRSSLNALRHGLTGHVIVLPSEDRAAYETHTQRLFDDLQPKGALEEQLVQSLADTSWRINRIAALETNLLASPWPPPSANKLAHYRISAPTSTAFPANSSGRSKQKKTKWKKPPESSNYIRLKELPTIPPTMASFFQMTKSKPPSAAPPPPEVGQVANLRADCQSALGRATIPPHTLLFGQRGEGLVQTIQHAYHKFMREVLDKAG